MKTVHFFLCILAFFFSSCYKESFDQRIIGTWQLKHSYDGYANGGSFQWHAVSEDFYEAMQFNSDGTFTQTHQSPGSAYQYSGTYKIIGTNMVEFYSNRYTGPKKQTIQLEKDRLTIVHPVREGQVIDRYFKID